MKRIKKIFLPVLSAFLLFGVFVSPVSARTTSALTSSGNNVTASVNSTTPGHLVIGVDIRNNATGALISSPDPLNQHNVTFASRTMTNFTAGRAAFSSHENRTTGYWSTRSLVR